MSKKISIIGTCLASLVGTFIGMEIGLDGKLMEKIPPEIVISDNKQIERRVYVPHSSVFKGVSWYDRVIEIYELNDQGDYTLKRTTKIEYHYPLFGIGESKTTTRTI